jgi:sugar phosphate isomerase/epimerase
MPDPLALDRRGFLRLALAGGVAAPASAAAWRGAAAPTSMFLAFTSFAVRLDRARDGRGGPPFDAGALLEQCVLFGARGAQVALSQLPVGDRQALAALRAAYEQREVEIELSLPASSLDSEDAFAHAREVAAQVGSRRARVALLSGRRYEDFASKDEWERFAAKWRGALLRLRRAFDRHRFPVGIENHKDFLTADLVRLLREVDSEYLGACVDFGNNLAMLDDPDETIERLAPYAVTTHVKDMAVVPTSDGFELSEVPLGQGLLPLDRYVDTIRRVRPSAPFCLEMITRDPLRVPYKTERYWAPFAAEARSAERIRRFERCVLSRAWNRPLPRVSPLTTEARLAAEDENVRVSLAYAREALAFAAS